jgi:hypothetical protein
MHVHPVKTSEDRKQMANDAHISEGVQSFQKQGRSFFTLDRDIIIFYV